MATAAPLISNGFSAIAGTVAVFALSTSAGTQFWEFAASTAALILAYGTARSLLGEPLMLTQRDRKAGEASPFPSIAGWTTISVGVGVVLGSVAALGVTVAGIPHVSWITFAAVSALVFNDAARHLCFARGSAWTAAIADGVLMATTAAVWAAASRLDPFWVYGIWLLGAASTGVFMVAVVSRRALTATTAAKLPADIPATVWVRSSWRRTRWLTAEAVAVTAAVTLPLILAADDVAGPGRLLLSWFGFQQILFFAAYAVATRSGARAAPTALLLFCAGAAGAISVSVAITIAPADLLVDLFGPLAREAQRWALWFGVLQLITAAGNAAALGARLISGQQVVTATNLFRGRLTFAVVSTICGVAGALAAGVGGYIVGSSAGGLGHVIASLWILRRSAAT